MNDDLLKLFDCDEAAVKGVVAAALKAGMTTP